jgi:hypothetical protein
MRVCEAKIKEALLHPEQLARQAALIYFTESYSRDQEVMPLVIRALERYGREDAFRFVHQFSGLAQTEGTVDWAIRELREPNYQMNDSQRYHVTLSRLLCNADPRLWADRAEDILKSPGFLEDFLSEVEEQLQIHAWDAERCWKELEDLSRKYMEDDNSAECDFDRVDRIAMQLARQKERYEDRIVEVLGREVGGFDEDPTAWMQCFLVIAAGEMRLEKAVPRLIQMLQTSDTEQDEDYVTALVKIGTDGVVEGLTENWSQREWGYRSFVATALARIHRDASVRKSLELLPQEEDETVKTQLAVALLEQFDSDAVEPVRAMIREKVYDDGFADLKKDLVAANFVMEVPFPELEEWKQDTAKKEAWSKRQERELSRMVGTPRFDSSHAHPKGRSERSIGYERSATEYPRTAPIVRDSDQVGRNDPCPCGSGKKFKKCCLKKRSPA